MSLAILDGITIERPPVDRHAAAERAVDRLASTLCRRLALRHPCAHSGAGKPPQKHEGTCRHRNHRRDAALVAYLCEELGITGELADDCDYVAPLEYHSLQGSDMPLLRVV